jgi:uncharacterized coiled-coil protein SlyX
MPETQKRTVEQVHQEYSQVCAQAGHAQYQVFVHTKDLELLNNKLRDLNNEADKLRAEQTTPPTEGSTT